MDRSGYADTAHAERPEMSGEELDNVLDKALEETFPASDPISILQPAASVHHKRDRKKR
jgi:hypothetical protein